MYLILKICPICQREFRQRSANPSGRKYCNKECRAKARRNSKPTLGQSR